MIRRLRVLHRSEAPLKSASSDMIHQHANRAVKHVVLSTFDNPDNRHYGGGGADAIFMLARWLSTQHDVTVVTAGTRNKTLSRDGVRYRQLPVSWAGPRAGQLLFHLMLPFAARRIPHDLWMESFTPPFSTSFLPIFSRSSVVGIAQNLSGKEMWGRYRIPFFLIERLGLRSYPYVVVLNTSDGTTVSKYSPSTMIRVIPNYVELPVIDQALIGRGDHVLFLGRIDIWHKGLDILIEAYARSGLTMPMLIAGNGTPRDERRLRHLLNAAGTDNVQWLGRISGQQKNDILERSAFLVMPSRHETFGVSALEGMAYGKPVIHFELPSLSWMDGDVNVPAFDVDSLASEMSRLATDEKARRALGRAARSAARHFGPEEMAERYLSLVQEILTPDVASIEDRHHGAQEQGK